MATKYGYMIYVFRAHPYRSPDEAAVLGQLGGRGEQDALTVLYGALQAMTARRISEKSKHIQARTVEGVGRTIRFSVSVGQSGQSSEFFGPTDSVPVFTRLDEHIETNVRRGLVVVPSRATVGLLALEVHGRSGAKALLVPILARLFRRHTGLVLDVDAVADEAALQKFIAEAQAHEITLRRTGLPRDIADAVEMNAEQAPAGKLELKITPGRLKHFQQALIGRLRGDDPTRSALLQMHGLQFDELSVGMEVGERRTTLTVTADSAPTFIYDIRTQEIPDEQRFYDEVVGSVREMAPAVGVNVTPGWDNEKWSDDAHQFRLNLLPEESDDDAEPDTTQ
jgi:hypothetical protein